MNNNLDHLTEYPFQYLSDLLKDIEKEADNIKSYNSPEFPVSKQLIETIVSFVKKQP